MPLDIGVGILLALGVHEWFGTPLTPLLILFGIVAALLPDIDIVTALFGRWRHRGITHYPLVYIPVFILFFFFLPLPYWFLLVTGILAHFIHDTFGIGWGIAWFWPFTGRKFLLFPGKERKAILGNVATWLPKQEEAIRNAPYEGRGGNWVRNFYFRPNTLAYIEYGVLLLALVTLTSYLW